MSDIQKVKVGSTVTELEEGLFKNMKLLREVDFSGSPTSLQIPKQCFKGCEKLQKCIYPGASDLQEDDGIIYLDHIIGNGAWIDTGIVPTLDTIISFEVQQRYADNFTSGYNYWIGTQCSGNDFRFHFTSREITSGDVYWRIGDSLLFWRNIAKWQWMTVTCQNNALTSNVAKVSGTKATSLDTGGKTITVFGGYCNGYLNIEDFRIRYLKIFSKSVDNLQMHLVPVIDASNEVCFLDKVSNKYFKSQNSAKMIGVTA